MPAGDTYRLLEQQQKICQNRDSKWGTQVGEEREEGLIFIWCLNCAQCIGEHYIYVISLQVALIMWLDYILKDLTPCVQIQVRKYTQMQAVDEFLINYSFILSSLLSFSWIPIIELTLN